jgi:hypothetical protein
MKKRTQTPTNPQILARIDALGVSDRAAEEASGAPQGFLSKARRGECGSARAAATWARILAWLEREEAARASGTQAPPTLAPVAVTTPTVSSEPAVSDEIVSMIENAHSHDACTQVLRRLASLMAAGKLERHLGEALEGVLSQLRMSIRAAADARALVDSSKPVNVIVDHVSDWRREEPVLEAKKAAGG